MEEQGSCRPHVLVVPYPAQGHINPMLQFSKRLVFKGVKVTLAITKYISKSACAVDPASSLQVDVETISDGFDDGGLGQAGGSYDVYLRTLKLVGTQTLTSLVKKLNESPQPVTAIIYDGFLSWALDVAKQFGLAGVVFFTQSCAVSNIYYHLQHSLLSLPLSGPVDSLPGLPALEIPETPSYLSDFGSYPSLYDILVGQFQNIDDADWVLYNSFHKLEEEVVDWMTKRWRVGTIGPAIPSMYLDKRLEDDKDYCINLTKPDTSTCKNWLRDKPSGSVVYVSLGSLAELEIEQMRELAWALKGSNCNFLWIVRASEEAKLPNNFKEETSDKGLVVAWCSQLEVLAHESVGCFVTHCGFNSIIEALSLGVPMVAIPQWTDQPTNAKYVEDVWKVGIRVWPDGKGFVRSEDVKRCIREVMEGEKGKEIKENSRKWKDLAKEAVDEGGTSDKNINEFVAKLLCS